MPTQSLLVKASRQVKAMRNLLRGLTDQPAIHEVYLSYADSLGNSNVAEILVRLTMDLTKQCVVGAHSIYEASKKKQLPQITGRPV